jgi:hypothetical protein
MGQMPGPIDGMLRASVFYDERRGAHAGLLEIEFLREEQEPREQLLAFNARRGEPVTERDDPTNAQFGQEGNL